MTLLGYLLVLMPENPVFDLGDLRAVVQEVSNCLFTELVAKLRFFTGSHGAGGGGDSGELFNDDILDLFFTGVVCFLRFSFWESLVFGRDGILLPMLKMQ